MVNVEQKGAAILRQIRSVKANEGKPLMKGRNNLQTRSKPGYGVNPGNNGGVALQAATMASGLEVVRARNRLEHGTFEPVVPMLREPAKRGNRKAQSTNAADDIVIHCRTLAESQAVKAAVQERLRKCKLGIPSAEDTNRVLPGYQPYR